MDIPGIAEYVPEEHELQNIAPTAHENHIKDSGVSFIQCFLSGSFTITASNLN
jgi:hypothetical protein